MNGNLVQTNGAMKRRYKMYKAGKHWYVAAIMFVGAGVALLTGGQVAAAANEDVTGTPEVATQQQPVTSAETSAAADSADSADPVDPADFGVAAPVAAPTAQPEDNDTATPAPTDTAPAPIVERHVHSDQAVDVDAAKADAEAEAHRTGATAMRVTAVGDQTVTTADERASTNFETTGSAHTDEDGHVILTNDDRQYGTATWPTAIDMHDDFEFHATVDLGQWEGIGEHNLDGEGDWLSIVLADADDPDGPAFGWHAVNSFNEDKYEAQHGIDADDAFAALLYKNRHGDLVSYHPNKSSAGDTARLQEIRKPEEDRWGNVDFMYDSQRTRMTVVLKTYDGLVPLKQHRWSRNVADWVQDMTAATLTVTGRTGIVGNILKFKLTGLCYSPARAEATVGVEYRTSAGDLIGTGTATYPHGNKQGETYTTSPLPADQIPDDYYFSWVDPSGLPESGTLTKPGDNGTVVYLYAPFQKATVGYYDDTLGQLLEELTQLSGKANDAADYSSADKVAAYAAQGYELVRDETTPGITFDDDEGTTQTFAVHLQHQIVPVTHDEPGDADPSMFTKTVTRKISYVDAASGQTAFDDAVQSTTLTREGTENLVTKQIDYGPWQGDANLVAVRSPERRGYVPDQWVVPAIEIGLDNLAVKVLYREVAPLEVPPVSRKWYRVGEPPSTIPAGGAEAGPGIHVYETAQVGEPVLTVPDGYAALGDGIHAYVMTQTGEPVFTVPDGYAALGDGIHVYTTAQVGEPLFTVPEGYAKLGDGIHVYEVTQVGEPLFVNLTGTDPGVPATPIIPGDGTPTVTPEPDEGPGLPDTDDLGGEEPPEDSEDDVGERADTEDAGMTQRPQTATPGQQSLANQLGYRSAGAQAVATNGAINSDQRNDLRQSVGGQSTLPQTGDTSHKTLAVVGSVLAAMIGLFGLSGLRRRFEK